jgi:hypothetical protein
MNESTMPANPNRNTFTTVLLLLQPAPIIIGPDLLVIRLGKSSQPIDGVTPHLGC